VRLCARLQPILGITLLAAACNGRYVYGEQADRIKVSHAKHIKASVDCTTCHDKVWDAKTLGLANVLPLQDACKDCHQKEFDSSNCRMCHTDAAKPMPYFRDDRHLKMNHATHIPLVKEDCTVCHKSLPEPGKTYSPPTMDSCFTCHEHKDDYNAGRCDVCHTDLSHYPEDPVSTFSHQGNWVKLHQTAARVSTEACSKCHDATYCSSCHDAQTVPVPVETLYPEHVEGDFQIHRGDWLSRHSLEAQADETECRRCHGVPFCTTCHTQQNLTPAGTNPRNPHPPGWAFPGANSHANAARTDIASCQSCHDQGAASVCISCHKVGGIGGNPHPSSFLSRHSASQIHQSAMCLYCHQ
jgi:hypothetical protein